MSSARDLRRIATIGDGVFVVVVTLMAHRVQIPPAAVFEARELVPLLPFLTDVLAVAMSFFVASMLWIAHWRVFHRVRRCDLAFIGSNLAFLGTLVLLPISTQIMSTMYMTSTGAMVYSANLFLSALAQLFFRRHARRVDPAAFHGSRLMVVPVLLMTLFALGGVVGYFWPRYAMYFWFSGFFARMADRKWGLKPLQTGGGAAALTDENGQSTRRSQSP